MNFILALQLEECSSLNFYAKLVLVLVMNYLLAVAYLHLPYFIFRSAEAFFRALKLILAQHFTQSFIEITCLVYLFINLWRLYLYLERQYFCKNQY
jgi:hypothetical protein